jgi:hypothetical protein
MLQHWLERLSPAAAHRLLGWLGIDVDAFHDWMEGYCTCGYIRDYAEEDAA